MNMEKFANVKHMPISNQLSMKCNNDFVNKEFEYNDLLINRYTQNGDTKKILGAVYTPPRVAQALVKWAIRSPHDRVLDPACGEGVFLSAARDRLANIGNINSNCIGVDIDHRVVATFDKVIHKDFFEWSQSATRFDAIVGNPPFIRSHLFPEYSRMLAFKQMDDIGLHPSRLMSTWAPFLAISCKLLSEKGRLAFVIPEELLHVSYAKELRNYLLSCFRRVIVCLPNGNIFTSVQQSTVLLLCENDSSGPSGLFTIQFSELEEGKLHSIESAPVWNWCSKWTHMFLSQSERKLVSESFNNLKWNPIKEYGRVEVGVVTGFNSFFIVPKSKLETLGAGDLFAPIITSARNLQGIQLTPEDFNNLVKKDISLFLINTSNSLENLPIQLQEYLLNGEEQGINLRYKCRLRQPWYAVPGVWPVDALLLRQAGEIPRIVHLNRKYTSTDTIHRVRWQNPSVGKLHAVSFLNTFTLIACELIGRSYGGGVLELMPSEANSIPLPHPTIELKAIFNEVDSLMRDRNFNRAIELVDNIVIPKDFTSSNCTNARNVLFKLINRRKNKQNGNS